jgi:hypothetical protein
LPLYYRQRNGSNWVAPDSNGPERLACVVVEELSRPFRQRENSA